jgi:hypothetical protein
VFQKTEIVSFEYSLFKKDKRRSDIEFSLFSTGIYVREMIIIGNKPNFVGTLLENGTSAFYLHRHA